MAKISDIRVVEVPGITGWWLCTPERLQMAVDEWRKTHDVGWAAQPGENGLKITVTAKPKQTGGNQPA
jgi:hypothetical protein